MSAAWIVCVRGGEIVTDEPWMARPIGKPDFGPTELDREATSWVDETVRHFLPVIEANPRLTLYVEVGNDHDTWGIMHAWLIPRSVAARYTAENHGYSERRDPRRTFATEVGPTDRATASANSATHFPKAKNCKRMTHGGK